MVNRESLNRQSQQMTVKPVPIFGRSKVTSSVVMTMNLDFIQLYVPREETFPIPLKYIDVTWCTRTDLDVLQEKRIDDYWTDDSSRHVSDSWKGFTKFTQLKERPPKGHMWSGRRLTKIQTTTRPDHVQGGRLAPDPFRLSKLGMASFVGRNVQKIVSLLLLPPPPPSCEIRLGTNCETSRVSTGKFTVTRHKNRSCMYMEDVCCDNDNINVTPNTLQCAHHVGIWR